MYDLLVIGGGPGGCAAALRAARGRPVRGSVRGPGGRGHLPEPGMCAHQGAPSRRPARVRLARPGPGDGAGGDYPARRPGGAAARGQGGAGPRQGRRHPGPHTVEAGGKRWEGGAYPPRLRLCPRPAPHPRPGHAGGGHQRPAPGRPASPGPPALHRAVGVIGVELAWAGFPPAAGSPSWRPGAPDGQPGPGTVPGPDHGAEKGRGGGLYRGLGPSGGTRPPGGLCPQGRGAGSFG